MPIARRQFEEQRDTLDIRILDFLRQNQEYAYTAKEIGDRLGEDHLDVVVALNRMADDMVERRMVDGEHYFAIKRIITKFLESIL